MVSPFGQRHAAHWFYAGFREIHNTGKPGRESAQVVTPRVQRWLQEHAHEDHWYLHVNYWDIHTPCRVSDSFGDPIRGQPAPAWITDDLLQQHVAKSGPHSAQDAGMYRDGDPVRFPRTVPRIVDRMACSMPIPARTRP